MIAIIYLYDKIYFWY